MKIKIMSFCHYNEEIKKLKFHIKNAAKLPKRRKCLPNIKKFGQM
jgi:hypothetical protein